MWSKCFHISLVITLSVLVLRGQGVYQWHNVEDDSGMCILYKFPRNQFLKLDNM